jgi:hypothetical protein
MADAVLGQRAVGSRPSDALLEELARVWRRAEQLVWRAVGDAGADSAEATAAAVAQATAGPAEAAAAEAANPTAGKLTDNEAPSASTAASSWLERARA